MNSQVATPATMRETRWVLLNGVLALVYVAMCAGVGAALDPAQPIDFDVSHWPAVQSVLAGHPLLLYQASTAAVSDHGPWVALDHGPVSIAPLSAVGYMITELGWADMIRVRRGAALALTALFSVLMAREATRLAEVARGEPLNNSSRFWARAALLFAPALGLGVFGHVELPMAMWLYLRSIRALTEGRTWLSAGVAGLAMLTRSTIILLALPLAVFLLVHRGTREAATWCAVAAVVVLAVMAPFLITDPGGTLNALAGVLAHQPLSYGSVLVVVAATPIAGLIQRLDDILVLGAVLLFLGVMRRSLRGGRVGEPRMFMVLVGVAICWPLLAKVTFAYYLFEAGVLVVVWLTAVWDTPDRPRAAVVTGLVGLASLGEYVWMFAHPDHPGLEFGVSVVCGGLMLLALREIASGHGAGLETG